LQDREGLSALHAAALMGNGSALKLVLQFCPASADIRDNQGRSFLHAACFARPLLYCFPCYKESDARKSSECPRPGREHGNSFGCAGRGIQSCLQAVI
jgi:hypothetical protein